MLVNVCDLIMIREREEVNKTVCGLHTRQKNTKNDLTTNETQGGDGKCAVSDFLGNLLPGKMWMWNPIVDHAQVAPECVFVVLL